MCSYYIHKFISIYDKQESNINNDDKDFCGGSQTEIDRQQSNFSLIVHGRSYYYDVDDCIDDPLNQHDEYNHTQ